MAALEIASAVSRFNAAHADTQLPARIGLHVGQLSVEQDLDGVQCTVLGHALDVATRFEQLGKTLLGGTENGRASILTSAEVVEGLGDDLVIRYLGRHELKGVGREAAYELIGERDRVAPAELEMCERFAAALRLYEDGKWQEAHLAFGSVLALAGEDRPSRYFAGDCAARMAQAGMVGEARA